VTSAGGDAMLAELLKRCLSDAASTFDSVSPPYAAVFYDGRDETAHVLVDRLGFQHLYVRKGEDGRVWISSSGLTLAAGMHSTVDPHHVAEWLAMGHFMSDKTLVREVRKLGCGEHVQLTSHGIATVRSWQPRLREPDLVMGESLVEQFSDEFRRSVAITAVGPGLATEMTGGIDSRYLLAALLDNGISPLAWTMGQPGWSELKIIERLRERRPFEHRVVTLDARIVPRLPDLVEEMQQLSDGEANALEYAPLLVAFEELDDVRTTSLSGVAGEIARGFYFGLLRSQRQLRDVPVDALLVKETRPAAAARDSFSTELAINPLDELRAVVETFVSRSPAETAEGILEDLYLRARLQRFAGRNFTTTGYFCRQGLPYFDNEFVDFVLRLPFDAKRDGWILRRSLMQIAPDFATVPLTAGMAVAPSSLLRPDRIARRYSALARRAATKYGGNVGRRLAATGAEMKPWSTARADPRFGEFVRDLLLERHAETSAFLDRGRVTGVIDSALAGRSMYSLGLLLTLELTLRTINGPGRTP
jgi:asparagine synthetase B (glutamine-hydrolysing)